MTTRVQAYAATVLHNLLQHMDVAPAHDKSHVLLTAVVPAAWIPALELFDADGDPDLDEVCEDEGVDTDSEPQHAL